MVCGILVRPTFPFPTYLTSSLGSLAGTLQPSLLSPWGCIRGSPLRPQLGGTS